MVLLYLRLSVLYLPADALAFLVLEVSVNHDVDLIL